MVRLVSRLSRIDPKSFRELQKLRRQDSNPLEGASRAEPEVVRSPENAALQLRATTEDEPKTTETESSCTNVPKPPFTIAEVLVGLSSAAQADDQAQVKRLPRPAPVATFEFSLSKTPAPLKRKDSEPGRAMQLSVRLEPGLAVRLDNCVALLAQSTGLTVSRTDVARLLMKEALDARDARLKREK